MLCRISLISECGQILRIYWEALQNFLDELRVDSYLYPDYFRRFNFNLFRSRPLCCCLFIPAKGKRASEGVERREKKREKEKEEFYWYNVAIVLIEGVRVIDYKNHLPNLGSYRDSCAFFKSYTRPGLN